MSLKILMLPFIGLLTLSAQSALAEKIIIQLKWLHQFQFAGFYAAEKEGYFADLGLEMELRPRDLQKNPVEQVLNGEAHYGVADSVLLLYQARGAPLVIVAPILQQSPLVLLTLKSSGLDNPYVLAGKKVAFYQKDMDIFPTIAMLEQINVTTQIDRVYRMANPEILLRGEVDAYPAYLSDDPYFFKERGIGINILQPRHYGIDLYGDILFTTRQERENNPQRVEKIRQAVIQGWEYALVNPEEMAQYILDTYAPAGRTLDYLRYEAQIIEEMMQAKTIPIGSLDPGRLIYIQQLFQKHGLVDKPWSPSEGIYRPTEAEELFSERESQWLKEHPSIRLGIDQNWQPIDFIDRKGEFSGIAAQLIQYLSRKTGLEFTYDSQLPWLETLDQIKNRDLDMLSAVTPTTAKSAYLAYSLPYLHLPLVLASKINTPYFSNFKQLENKTLAVAKGYAAHDLLKEHYPEINLLLVDTPLAGLKAVAAGKAFAYIDNAAVIGALIAKHRLNTLQIGGELPFQASVTFGIRQDLPELLSIINKVLEKLPPEELEKMQQQYLEVVYRQQLDWQNLLKILLPVLFALILVLSLYLRLLQTQKQLKASNNRLQTLSSTDHLTQVHNRSFLDQCLKEAVQSSNRPIEPRLSVLLIDLDFFKKVNDQHGHNIGDQVLIIAAAILNQQLGDQAKLGRWGGEEFLIIYPQPLAAACVLAENLRQAVKNSRYPNALTQTISIGVAEYAPGESPSHLIFRADEALYQAKAQGRDQWLAATPEKITVATA